MKKIIRVKDLESIKFPKNVEMNIREVLLILKKEYDKEWIGGCVILIESFKDIEDIKSGFLENILPEYTDEIICSEGVIYTSSLFLLSSDYSVVVIAEEKLSKILLEEYKGEI